MRQRPLFGLLLILATLFSVTGASAGDPGGPSAPAGPVSTSFTYQGQLQSGAGPVNGSCAMAFRLYDALSGGALVGKAITTSVTVASGLFTVPLDFGAGAFTGQARWLDIRVKCGADPAFSPLNPRQPLTAAPYALYALSAGAAPYAGLTGVPAPLHDLASPAACASAQVPAWTGSTWACATVISGSLVYAAGAGLVLTGTTFALDPAYSDGRYWKVNGNGGTSAANFVGTTDNVTLTLAVNGSPALRLAPTGNTPNLIGGASANNVSAGDIGATIAGGGNFLPNGSNHVGANYGTIGGGNANSADGLLATVAGGRLNVASGNSAAIGGGLNNTASADYASLAGGQGNVISATAGYGTVGGGLDNTASGAADAVGGGQGNFASNNYTSVGGGYFNLVTGNTATVAGGGGNAATGTNASVGGGQANTASGGWTTIAGGYYNTATVGYDSVGGGDSNMASGGEATIGGGGNNVASQLDATIGGGGFNNASGPSATIAGGAFNIASGDLGSTVGGGWENTASNRYTAVSGGFQNTASGHGAWVGGGETNIASGDGATVGGGGYNGAAGGNVAAGLAGTIAGGFGNAITTTAAYATIGGGANNTASDWFATVPGGDANRALGAGSFAAGDQARALYEGDFVWSDRSGSPISSTVTNQFVARAAGGVTFYTNAGASVGASLAAGSGSWSIVSDRNLKANFARVDGLQILNALAGIPIESWNYQTQEASIRHLGPMAQDFHAAFGVGENDTTISTVDAQGVALAAVQELYTLDKQKDGRLAAQQAQIDALQAQQAGMAARLAALDQRSPDGSGASLPWGWLLFGALALLNVGGMAGYGLARRAAWLSRRDQG